MVRRKGRKAPKSSDARWNLEDFDIGKKLSCGKFARYFDARRVTRVFAEYLVVFRVYVARKKRSDYLVALKVLKKETIRQHQMAQYLQSEIQILSNLRHPNMYDFCALVKLI